MIEYDITNYPSTALNVFHTWLDLNQITTLKDKNKMFVFIDTDDALTLTEVARTTLTPYVLIWLYFCKNLREKRDPVSYLLTTLLTKELLILDNSFKQLT
jgi:hypothetical protein